MPDLTVSFDLDALLAKQTLAEAKTYLGVTANETAITTEETRALAAEGANAANIATNATDIATNATDIATNAADITTEVTRATAAEGANATNIATNTADIATNVTDIATNVTGIATNAANIATNATDIATETTRATTAEGQLNTALSAEITRAGTAEQANATNIATNATNIATNVTNIATNATDISTNATDIATNATDISNEETRALAAEALLAPIADATFTGTTTIPSADITTADFNAAGLGGELSWNDQEKTLDLATGSGVGADEVVIQVGQEVVLYAKNKSNVNMTNGQVVLVSGTSGQEPSIELAQADTVGNARRAIGVITQDIADNTSGFVTLIGKVRGLELDENTFSLGEVVYLSSTVAGGITTVQPDISVEIGHVVSTSTGNNKQGVLEVQLNNESAVYELEQELTTAINLKAPLVDPAFTTTPQGSATINNNSILTDFNVGLDVQAHSDVLDGTTASFTTAQATAIIDNYAATPHNTNSVIICNQGDNLQAKYDEAAVLSISNKVTLLLMAGTYGNLAISNAAEGAFGVDVIGVGTVSIGDLTSPSFTNPILSQFKNFICNSLNLATSFSLIEDIRVNGSFSVDENLGIIRKVTCATFYTSLSYGTIDDISCQQTFTVGFGGNYGTIKNVNATNSFTNFSNTGTIKNCESSSFLGVGFNDGIIDNCHSTSTSTTSRSFFGNIGSSNQGTIKNCTAKGDECFGQQGVNGVTEYCTSRNRGFAGVASNLDFFAGSAVQGTYRNCVAGTLSFLGNNNTTDSIKTIEATYINCSAGANSFGFVNTTGAETHFSGTAINCTSGLNGFFSANNGSTTILAGAVIENCIGGGINCFAANATSFMEGTILRCRTGKTGANAFKVSGTGKVRLCLDGDFNEVNLPIIP